MTEFKAIGQPTPLREGREKITGSTRYAPDMTLPNMLYARFVTSLYAHARIREINDSAAKAVPGVVSVIKAEDLPEVAPTARYRLLLARDRVIFSGQPVAVVLGTSEAAVEEASVRVNVDYEPLPSAITLEEALAENPPLVWPTGKPGESEEAAAHGAEEGGEEKNGEEKSNIANRVHFSRGDPVSGFKDADLVVERTFTTPMVHQSYLEPHATIVQPDLLTGGATVWSSTQAPFWVREEVADTLRVPESDVRVVATPVGGGFGGKFLLYEPLIALIARVVARPVRLVLTRQEEMQAGNPAPLVEIRLRIGARNDGSFVALEGNIVLDCGCFPNSLGGLASVLLGSLYQFPNFDIRGTEVLTFKPSTGAYRAPTAPVAAFAIESIVDEVAETLGMDPIDLRQKNASRPGDLMVHDKPWPKMGLQEVLSALQSHPAWLEREKIRAKGRGVGIAVGGWPGGIEPAAATCSLNRDGNLLVHLGSVDLTGTATGFALVAAESFGIDPDSVRVVLGDTATAPYAGAAGGSKITYTVGPAIIQAAQEARLQVFEIASEEFEVDTADLEIVDGNVQVRGVPDKAIPLREIAAKTMRFGGKYAPIFGHGRHAETAQAPGFCAQLAEVEVDEETGQVFVHRLVVVQDVGRAINPLAVKGQMMGGATQGLGWALHERIVYDEQGQLLTGTWMDYTVPNTINTATIIDTVMVEVPSEYGPFGARGVGEPPVIPTAGAVANAIRDAAGVRLTDLPMTAQDIWEAISNKPGKLESI